MSAQLKRWLVGSAGALLVSATAALAQSPTTDPSNPGPAQRPPVQKEAIPQEQTGQQAMQQHHQAMQQHHQAMQQQPVVPLPDQAKAKVIADVRKLGDAFAKDWSAHDPKALAKLFTADGALQPPMGEGAAGRAELEQRFTEILQGPMKDTTMTVNVDTVRALSPDLVMVDLTHTVSNVLPPGQSKPVTDEAHSVLVSQRQNGQWRIREMRVHAMPPGASEQGVGGSGDVAPVPDEAANPQMKEQFPEQR